MYKVAFVSNFWRKIELADYLRSRYGRFRHGLEIVSIMDNYDYLIILNWSELRRFDIPQERIIGMALEPEWSSNYRPSYLETYCGTVISHTSSHLKNSIFGPVLHPIFVSMNINYNMNPEDKTKNNTFFNSLANHTFDKTTYKFRSHLVQKLRQYKVDCDLYGRSVGKFLDRKEDGMLDYRYCIAIENSIYPGYCTEKLADCFVTMCMPIYYGDPNVNKYFTNIPILDIENPIESIREITSKKPDIDTLYINRNLYRNKYNPIAQISKLIYTQLT